MTTRALQNRCWQSATLALSGGLLALGAAGCGSGFHYLPNESSAAPSNPTAAQAVSAPGALGYAWDRADATLRPIQGVIGASHVGASLIQAGAYVAGEASPISNLALLVRNDGSVDRMILGTSATITLGGVSVPQNAVIRFAPSGASAVVFSPAGNSVILLTNLATTPSIVRLPVPALVDAAVSDTGVVAVVQQRGSDSQVAILSSSGAQPVLSVTGQAALVFVPRNDSVLVLGTTASTVTLVQNFSTAPASSQINVAGLLKAPLSISVSQDARWAAIANSGDSNVVRLDLSGKSAPKRFACPVQPTTVQALGSSGGFRFSEVGTAPAWVADLSAATPSMLFVPAVAKS